MLPLTVVCVIAGVFAIPYLAVAYPAQRKGWWTCAVLAWLGIILVEAHISPDYAAAGLVFGPVVLAPWLLLWGIVGRRRRRAPELAARPGPTS
jgi:hypothetical protein